jgi:RNA polymerase sigma factor (sigma-70 family)
MGEFRMKNSSKDQELGRLVLTYLPQISFRVRRSLGDSCADWEDVTADIMMDAIRALKNEKFKGKSSVGTFLYVITSRRIVDYIRRKYKRPLYCQDGDGPDDTFDQVKKDEELTIIREALKKLKPRQADFLYLQYYMELTQTEIADIYGLSLRRVNELLMQGKYSLRRIIESGRLKKVSTLNEQDPSEAPGFREG